MNTTIPAQSGLVLNYRFDQGVAGGDNTAISTATDNSGLGNTGTLHSFTMTGNTSNFVSGNPSLVADVTLTNSFNGTANASGTYNSGVTTVIWTATDVSGNTSTCTQTVTVQDHQAPTISSCPAAQTASANGSCQANLPDLTSGVTANDNCTSTGSLVITQSPAAYTLVNNGVTTVTFTVADLAENTSTCSTTFTVIDNTPPVISCNNSNITQNNDNGYCSAGVTYTAPTATDNCGTNLSGNLTFNYTGSINTYTVPSGVNTLTMTAIGAAGGYFAGTPGAGSKMTGTFSVSPGSVLSVLVGQCPGYFDGEFAAGGGGTYIALGSNYSTATPLLVAGGGGGCYSGNGTNALITTSGDGPVPGTNGNGAASTTCGGGGGGFFTSGGNDQEYGFGGGQGFQEGGAGGTNTWGFQNGGFGGGAVCDFVGYCNIIGGAGGGYSGGSGLNSGNYQTYGYGGGSYNGGTNQTNTAGANYSGNGQVIISYLASTGPTVSQTGGHISGYAFPVGTTTNTFLATDASNNTSTCSFTVTVIDNQAPVMGTCPNNITQCNHVLSYSSPTATDNCSATVSCSPASGTTVNAGITTVVCTASDPSGNTATCSFTVTVVDLTIGITETDNSGTTANDGIICVGFSAGLDAGVHTSYSWSNGSTLESFTVSPTATTTYTVTVSNNVGCTGSTSQVITVNSNPSASASVTTPIACNGGNGVITVTAIGGTSPYTGTGTHTEPYGTYSFTVSDYNGCTSTVSQTITQPAAVTFTTVVTNATVCTTANNGSIAITASGGTGTKMYSDNNGSSYGGASQFSNLATGTYTVKVKDANSCYSAASNIVITRNTAVNFNTTVVNATSCSTANGKITVLATNGDGFYNYSSNCGSTWQSGNIFTALLPRAYSMQVKDAAGCTATCATSTVASNTGSCGGAKLVDNASTSNSGTFNIYPNPASTEVAIIFSSDREENYSIRIVDVTGRVVINQNEASVIGDNQYQLNLSSLAKGVYMVILQNKDAVLQSKIVVQ
jgi:hypothetical protein